VYLRSVPVVRNYKPTGRTLSRSTQELACMIARNFLTWARQHLRWYGKVDPTWIDTLRPGRLLETVQERELYTLKDVLAITQPSAAHGLKHKRDKAGVALLFLSGMRVGAFTTLPIQALDLDHLAVKQWPELGVATKNRKAATTYLLDIPELLDRVRLWDDIVRAALPPTAPWYARLRYKPNTGKVTIDRDGMAASERRRNMVASALRDLCAVAGVTYRSSHKLRHGHAVFGLKRARTIGELKAVSQNLMHADLTITNGVYGVLTDDDVQRTIASLGRITPEEGDDQQALIGALEKLLAELRRGS
jgi:integrase